MKKLLRKLLSIQRRMAGTTEEEVHRALEEARSQTRTVGADASVTLEWIWGAM